MYRYVNSASLNGSWKFVKKTWGHSLHRMCSRTGSFPPALARYFIEKFSKKGDRVLDPFSGKGTAPLEACLSERIGIGNDLAPEAYVLTYAKVRPVSFKTAKRYLDKIKHKMDTVNVDLSEVPEDVAVFYHPETLKQIIALKELLQDDDSDEAIFIKALMCGILHGSSEISLSLPCSHSFSMSPKYVKRYAKLHKLKRPRRDVIWCLIRKAQRVLKDGVPKIRGEAYRNDASQLELEDESVDLIITSPPYFDKQTYAWDNWLRLWFLGYNYRDINRMLFNSQSKSKFIKFITKCIKEMYRVLKEDSACFIVIGDVKLNGERINTAELIADIAITVGFDVKRIINDIIPRNAKYFMFIPKGKGIRLDRIVELHKGRVDERDVILPWNGGSENSNHTL